MSTVVRTLPVEEEQGAILAKEVRESCGILLEPELDFSLLHEGILKLESLIFALDQDQQVSGKILDCLTQERKRALNVACRSWETSLELEFANKFVNGHASLSDYALYDRFDALVRRELSLLSTAQPQRVIFIGSGSIPISAIHMHYQTGLMVDCASRDASAAAISRKVLQKCGLEDSVRIFANETEFDVSGYDLIVIEHLARHKKTILKTLRKRGRPGCQILCRTSSGLRQLLYEHVPDRDLRGFYIKREQVAEGMQAISTRLLESATSASVDIRLEWLRNINSDQALQILRLMNRTLEEETTIGFPGPIDEKTGFSLMRQLNADLEACRRHVLVAEKDGVVVGQLILTPNSSPNHRHIVELTRGTIDPSFRGGGLALRAFEEVVKKCEQLGREVICLDVRAGTMAAMWWQHFGFKPYGLLSDYSRVGDKRYQGLYLMQATADLKQRVKEIAATHGAQQPPFPRSE